MEDAAKNFCNRNLQQVQLNLLQKKSIQKTAEATGDWIGNKTSDKITKVSKSSLKNSLKTENIEYQKEIPKEI